MSSQDSSASYFLSAMLRLRHDSDTADFTLTCGENEWKLHSPILAIRSPFFKAAIATNMAEKRDMKMEIKELDPEAMKEVINFMYGKPIGEANFGSLLEASERFQMADMKKEVTKIGSKKITKENVLEIGKLAEFYDIEQLLQESAEFIVKYDIEMEEGDLGPKLTFRVLKEFKEALYVSKAQKLISQYADIADDMEYGYDREDDDYYDGYYGMTDDEADDYYHGYYGMMID